MQLGFRSLLVYFNTFFKLDNLEISSLLTFSSSFYPSTVFLCWEL